ncbi:hypothetical protein NEF87_000207 [Candidatus Lokiarchaeum ossiferum]|uniref:Uncharacterized protein n=1 Tax=Candidatus Lokiarchaeum ossiferum TaxID=2951803 RepID=A0ABY6HK71_9ARCH|nr:hypothetical protein NEF87_000207 [Candidatus Lokiarchaeum sp. B-35]
MGTLFRFQIPKTFKKNIQDLLSISESNRKKFLEQIQMASPTLEIQELIDCSESELQYPSQMLMFLSMIYRIFKESKTNLGDFRISLEDAINELGISKEHEKYSDIINFFMESIQLDNTLGISSKANATMIDHSQIIRKTRILTDIRPLFQDNFDESVKTGVIYHMLKLTTRQNKIEKNQYIAFDFEDLVNLKNTIDRALRKEKNIRQSLNDWIILSYYDENQI